MLRIRGTIAVLQVNAIKKVIYNHFVRNFNQLLGLNSEPGTRMSSYDRPYRQWIEHGVSFDLWCIEMGGAPASQSLCCFAAQSFNFK